MKKRLFCSALLLGLVVLFAQSAFAWSGRVVDIADGDTITVEPSNSNERVKIRLHGIDCPERKQPFGETARSFIYDAALYKTVEVAPQKKPDRYGRVVAVVYLESGISLQEMLVENGLAWVWSRYCKTSDPACAQWTESERKTIQAKRGLWAAKKPIAPWKWRKGQRE